MIEKITELEIREIVRDEITKVKILFSFVEAGDETKELIARLGFSEKLNQSTLRANNNNKRKERQLE